MGRSARRWEAAAARPARSAERGIEASEDLLRVLLVSNTYPPHDISGVGTLVREMAVRLEADGHTVRVLARRGDDPWVREVAASKRGFPFVVAGAFRRLFGSRGVEPLDFDVIHVHESDAISLVFRHRLARLFGRPLGQARLVATLQVSYEEEARQVEALYPRFRQGAGPHQPLSTPTLDERVFARLRAPIHALFGRLTSRWADAIVAPSRVTRTELEADYGARTVSVIANGIELGPSRPDARDVGASGLGPTFLYVGRLRTRKAVAVLLEAFARLHEQFPEATLQIVGSGEQAEALHAQAARLAAGSPGLVAAIHFQAKVDQRQISAVYAAADAFVLPSTYEGLPLVLLEAMAAGLPVVCTDVSGNPEAVADGETGLVVPARDIEALHQAMAQLAADPDLRRRFGTAGRRRVEERFTIQRIADEYLNLWREQSSDGPRAVLERA